MDLALAVNAAGDATAGFCLRLTNVGWVGSFAYRPGIDFSSFLGHRTMKQARDAPQSHCSSSVNSGWISRSNTVFLRCQCVHGTLRLNPQAPPPWADHEGNSCPLLKPSERCFLSLNVARPFTKPHSPNRRCPLLRPQDRLEHSKP